MTMPVLKSLIVSALCTIPICRPLHAELMQDFITQAFDWKIPSERPHLMLSRGVVLAWLKDPSTFLPADNAQGFYSSGDRSLVIVPPGTAFIAFPPDPVAARAQTADCATQNINWRSRAMDFGG
jgi:hypothetical protein